MSVQSKPGPGLTSRSSPRPPTGHCPQRRLAHLRPKAVASSTVQMCDRHQQVSREKQTEIQRNTAVDSSWEDKPCRLCCWLTGPDAGLGPQEAAAVSREESKGFKA